MPDVSAYRKAKYPTHLLELMDEHALGHLLNGFAYKLQAGISILYSIEKPASDQTLQRVDLNKSPELAQKVMHEFCRLYRGCSAHNSRCESWDKSIALKYYRGEWSGPGMYHCHMGLWDMTYPLLVNGVLVGVLFGGQMVVQQADHREVQDRARQIEPKVRVDCAHVGSANQLGDIALALDRHAEPEHRGVLREALNSPGMKMLNAEECTTRINHFLNFGQTMDLLLKKLHDLVTGIEERNLLQKFEMELAGVTAQAQDRTTWREGAAEAFRNFEEVAETGTISLYYRLRSRYIKIIEGGRAVGRREAKKFRARLCFPFPENEFVKIDPKDASALTAALGITAPVWLFRYESPAGGRGFSVVFLLRECPSANTLEFCRVVSRRAEIADTLYRSMESQQAFAERVRQISHAVKTPLMVAMTEMRRIRYRIGLGELPDEEHVENARQCLLDARAELAGIYGALPPPRVRLDLRDVLNDLKHTMDVLAEAKRCTILFEPPDEPVVCEVCASEIRVAFRNLLDNAIKYSFDGKRIPIIVRPASTTRVEVAIENYGVGIPDDKPGALLEWGIRGDVADPKRPGGRPGSGLGVPIARGLLHKHGGTIDFESRPTHGTQPGTWLNYVTRVIVTLPLANHQQGLTS